MAFNKVIDPTVDLGRVDGVGIDILGDVLYLTVHCRIVRRLTCQLLRAHEHRIRRERRPSGNWEGKNCSASEAGPLKILEKDPRHLKNIEVR